MNTDDTVDGRSDDMPKKSACAAVIAILRSLLLLNSIACFITMIGLLLPADRIKCGMDYWTLIPTCWTLIGLPLSLLVVIPGVIWLRRCGERYASIVIWTCSVTMIWLAFVMLFAWVISK